MIEPSERVRSGCLVCGGRGFLADYVPVASVSPSGKRTQSHAPLYAGPCPECERVAALLAAAHAEGYAEGDLFSDVLLEVQKALDIRCVDDSSKVGCSDMFGEEPRVVGERIAAARAEGAAEERQRCVELAVEYGQDELADAIRAGGEP